MAPTHGREEWEGLTSFIFGPDWFSMPLEGEEETKAPEQYQKRRIVQQQHYHQHHWKTLLPKKPNSSAPATVNSKAAPKSSGKGKQLLNIKGNDKSVSFSLLDRQRTMNGIGDGTTSNNDPHKSATGSSNKHDSSNNNAGSEGG